VQVDVHPLAGLVYRDNHAVEPVVQRFVEHDPDGKISYFRNSGTFLLRHGKWQAITWQATRVPEQNK
jgi:hypothetical protein